MGGVMAARREFDRGKLVRESGNDSNIESDMEPVYEPFYDSAATAPVFPRRCRQQGSAAHSGSSSRARDRSPGRGDALSKRLTPNPVDEA